MSKKSCLVIQGGSLRGVHSSGVLKVLQDEGISFDCVMGISAGALNGASFLSGQMDRAITLNTDFINNPDFIGAEPVREEQSLINFDFLFSERKAETQDGITVPPFNWERFYQNSCRFICGATSLESGKIVYFRKEDGANMRAACIASASLPVITPGVVIDEQRYYDGAIADPLLYRKALQEGYDKIVVLLTREKGYRRAPMKEARKLLMRVRFIEHRDFLHHLLRLHEIFNQQIEEIETREALKDPELFVIRPSQDISVHFITRSKERMKELAELGIADGKAVLPQLKAWLRS